MEPSGTRVVDRNVAVVDPRYDTFAVMNPRGTRKTRGKLRCRTGLSGFRFRRRSKSRGREGPLANGVIVVDGKGTKNTRIVSGSQTIVVSNGRLKLTTPGVAKIDCVDITQTTPVTVPTGNGTGTGTGTTGNRHGHRNGYRVRDGEWWWKR